MHAAFREDRDGNFLQTYGHDVLCFAYIFWSEVLWALGYPERARRLALKQRERAIALKHPWNLFWGLTGGTRALLYRGDTQEMSNWIEQARRLRREQAMGHAESVELFWGSFALVESGQYADGYAQAEVAARLWRERGGRSELSLCYGLMAKALGAMGRTEEGIALLHDNVAFMDEFDQRQYEVEVHRIRAELLLQRGARGEAQAEAAFRTALTLAERQNSKGWGLRAATGYANLLKRQARVDEARALPQPIYASFTEGFDTKDLVEAKSLLNELDQSG